MYSNKIMEEFYNPQNYGVIKGASGVGKVTSDVGSEIIKIFIKIFMTNVTKKTCLTYHACTTIPKSPPKIIVQVAKGCDFFFAKFYTIKSQNHNSALEN